MQPESSDGFASVGTILPEEGAALLPGGSFRFAPQSFTLHSAESDPAEYRCAGRQPLPFGKALLNGPDETARN
jgi:hypothetical protein